MLRYRSARPLAATALATVLVLAAAPAYADSGPGASSGASSAPAAAAPTGDGAKALCRRVPKLEARITRELTRLNGGPGVRGSVARLEARVADAKKEGHTAVATYLQDRLTYRESLVPMLQQRQRDLASVQTWCASQGAGS
ncbi:hypothetical protein [Streptacidiphilus monticola]|jgi:hypothetical protein|uniref:Uncharacterized protein n=1 Tax=Streptacidiphilus monticola TaxID=2161674 RepID=A0ABW1FVR8_9ACTN